MSQLTCSRR